MRGDWTSLAGHLAMAYALWSDKRIISRIKRQRHVLMKAILKNYIFQRIFIGYRID